MKIAVCTTADVALLDQYIGSAEPPALIHEAEERARERGFAVIGLGVSADNPRAAGLYARLGYLPLTGYVDRWSYEEGDGTTRECADACTLTARCRGRTRSRCRCREGDGPQVGVEGRQLPGTRRSEHHEVPPPDAATATPPCHCAVVPHTPVRHDIDGTPGSPSGPEATGSDEASVGCEIGAAQPLNGPVQRTSAAMR
ncbi:MULTISPECIES: GNAT family N-acetyltransferase [Streptomyces]|uniref:GNAT family N-acetyltransferase n=1 Tax=Streptomyces TaxID=1883 RepID=UPI000C437390|nr:MULTISPECIES: GNAT family N-acetyltransferase [Streptomyces]PIB09520.1 hypothetical protein B1C81_10240 [Streptomyces sp. HG99]